MDVGCTVRLISNRIFREQPKQHNQVIQINQLNQHHHQYWRRGRRHLLSQYVRFRLQQVDLCQSLSGQEQDSARPIVAMLLQPIQTLHTVSRTLPIPHQLESPSSVSCNKIRIMKIND